MTKRKMPPEYVTNATDDFRAAVQKARDTIPSMATSQDEAEMLDRQLSLVQFMLERFVK